MEPITMAYLGYQGFKVGTEIFGLFNDRNQDALYGHRIYREKQYAKSSAAQTINVLLDQGEQLENNNKVLEGASGKEDSSFDSLDDPDALLRASLLWLTREAA